MKRKQSTAQNELADQEIMIQPPRKGDISSLFMQTKYKTEIQDFVKRKLYSKKGNESTMHFQQFREALSMDVNQNIKTRGQPKDPPSPGPHGPKVNELTRLRKERMGKEIEPLTDFEIQTHFKRRMQQFALQDEAETKKEEQLVEQIFRGND